MEMPVYWILREDQSLIWRQKKKPEGSFLKLA
jgi:hypothetical protein